MKIVAQVPRIEQPTVEEFQEEYAAKGRPVIIRQMARAWPARAVMTPRSIRNMFGEVKAPVRETDDEFEHFFGGAGKTGMSLRDFIDLITAPQPFPRRPPYLGNVAFDHPTARQHFQRLKPMLPFPDYFPEKIYRDLRLWIGAPGQRSTIHNDNYHNLNAQMFGSKSFLLFSPEQHELLYTREINETCWASPVDPQRPDFDKFPLFRDAQAMSAELEEGDVLYIPIFWWHQAQAATVSISISNFIYLTENSLWKQ